MRVCIDTNVVLQLSAHSPTGRRLVLALLAGKVEWAVSNKILLEYEEVLVRQSRPRRFAEFDRFVDRLFLLNANVLFIQPQFRFHVVGTDPDDNKFVDCAIAAQADYIITEDEHFNALTRSGYRPKPIKPAEFIRRFC